MWSRPKLRCERPGDWRDSPSRPTAIPHLTGEFRFPPVPQTIGCCCRNGRLKVNDAASGAPASRSGLRAVSVFLPSSARIARRNANARDPLASLTIPWGAARRGCTLDQLTLHRARPIDGFLEYRSTSKAERERCKRAVGCIFPAQSNSVRFPSLRRKD